MILPIPSNPAAAPRQPHSDWLGVGLGLISGWFDYSEFSEKGFTLEDPATG